MASTLTILEIGYNPQRIDLNDFVSSADIDPKQITNIHCGFEHTIFSNIANQKFYAIGSNISGSCGVGIQPSCHTLTEIDYFENNNIQIQKLCVNVSSHQTFWITNTGKVYGHGRNKRNQLGLAQNLKLTKVCKPRLIPFLENVSDVQCAVNFSIAQCREPDPLSIMIVSNWSRHAMPQDIADLIVAYCAKYKFYATEYGIIQRKCTKKMNDRREWNEIKMMDTRYIVQVRTGTFHSLFLADDGSVWSCGQNQYAQCGFSDHEWINQVRRIKYFVDWKIKIIQIRCGSCHNLAIDSSGSLFSWGYNSCGQCGVGSVETVSMPRMVVKDVNKKAIAIDCGVFHSYFKTDDDRHYLFGKNDHNECMTFDGNKRVTLPFCINEVIQKRFKGKTIRTIALGLQCTRLILEKDKV